MLQINKTGVCSQCLSHTGPVPAHGACSLPAHTAQALDCSTGNHPRPALVCLHLPGLSRSGSGTRVVLRGTDSVGSAFCALPRSEQLRQERQDIYLSFNDEVFGECDCCDLSPPHSSVHSFPTRRSSDLTGSAPAHGTCSLPAHTARALYCSTGNNPRLALGFMQIGRAHV